MKKALKPLIIILSIIVALIAGTIILVSVNPRVKFLASVVRFTAETLPDSGFLLYDLDIMGVCRDYADGDIEFEGDVIAGDIEGFGYTSSAKVHGVRSFNMREVGAIAMSKVLFIDVGEVDVYAKDNTVYMIVPSFDNLAYSLTVNTDLFMKAPMLNGNLDVDWFTDNAGNFIEFSNDIDIEKTGNVYTDDDGTKSDEFKMIIPEGKGEFIWELLGLDMPDHDIELSMYITPACKTNRIVVDISYLVENTVVTIEGEDMGTCIVEKLLPDNESTTMIIKKRGDYLYANYLDVGGVYNTKDGNVYSATGVIAYDKVDVGYDIQVKRLKAFKDGDLIGEMYFDGNVHTTKVDTEPTSTATLPLDAIKNYSWEELRDNAQGIIDEIMEDVKAKL